MASGSSLGNAYLTLVPKIDKAAQAKIETQLNTAGATGATGFSSKLKSGVSSGVSAIASVAGTAAIAASTVAAAGIASTVSQAFSAAADYEQLIGGVETLFGSSADTVSAYAQQAYQTAGLSANEYMEQATSFAASLVSSLGGDQAAAAEYANMAMVDMSDNANKMGTDMESIQNAYQGFAKQNYTMLDNLKLGYGGTKEEMERLLSDAQAISGVSYDISSYSDVVAAIHTIQSEMGIAGTTATEASTTVSGSIGAMKAAWENFMISMGTGEGVQENLDALVESVDVALDNILPLVGTIFTSLGTIIAENLPTLFENIGTFLSENVLPMITNVATLIAENLPILLTNIVTWLGENAGTLLQAAIDFFLQLVTGIGEALPQILAAIPQIIEGIVMTIWNNREQIVQAAIDLIGNFVTGIGSCLGSVGEAALNIANEIGNEIMTLPEKALQWGADIIQGIIDGIWSGITGIGDAVCGIADTIASYLHFSEPDIGPLSNFHTFMPDMMSLMQQGLKDGMPQLAAQAERVASLLDFSGAAYSLDVNSRVGEAGRSIVTNNYVVNGMNYLPDSMVAQAVENVFTTVAKTQRMGV